MHKVKQKNKQSALTSSGTESQRTKFCKVLILAALSRTVGVRCIRQQQLLQQQQQLPAAAAEFFVRTNAPNSERLQSESIVIVHSSLRPNSIKLTRTLRERALATRSLTNLRAAKLQFLFSQLHLSLLNNDSIFVDSGQIRNGLAVSEISVLYKQ